MNDKTIILAGGGTGGPTAPLLAIADELKKQNFSNFLFIGTPNGPEKEMAKDNNIKFTSIPVVKWRRYFSFKNIIELFILPYSVTKALLILKKNKAAVVISAGGYIAVPVIWAAAILKIKIAIHQQDIHPTLTNKLTAPFANLITLTFPEQKKDFPKGIVTGNPIRPDIGNGEKEKALKEFNFVNEKPIVLIFGGGSGSIFINQLVKKSLNYLLSNIQILHLSGVKNGIDEEKENNQDGYVQRSFLTNEMANAYAATDIVICRAGLSTISELSYLGKVAVFIPIPNSHQEKNAKLISDKNAGLVLHEKDLDENVFSNSIIQLLNNKDEQNIYKKNINKIMPHDAAKNISEKILELYTSN